MAKKVQFTTNQPSATTDYLAADNTWKTIPGGGGGGGTVTSVAVTVPAALSVSGSPITTSGTIAISGAGTTSEYIKGDGTLGTTPTSLPPNGSAGGDLTGTYPNPTVHRVHNIDMQSGTPSVDEVWVYGGSPAKWQHQKLHASQTTNDSTVSGTNVDDALDTLSTNKQDTITGAASTITTSNLTGSRVLVSNGGGKVDVSAITTTEVGYLSGVTSDIQTQLNAKQGTLTLTTTGNSGAATLVGSTLNIPQYASVGSGASMLYSNVQTGTNITAGSTVYGGFINGAYQTLANEYLRIVPLPKNAIVSNFTVYALAQPATGSSVYTVRKNSVDTALVITIPAGSAAAFHTNTLTTVSFNALDYISVKAVNNASSSVQPVALSIICTI